MKYHFIPSRMATVKMQIITSGDKDGCGQMEPHTLPVGNRLGVPQKFKPYYSAIPFLDIYSMKTYAHIKTGTQIFMAALFILAKNRR